LAPLVHCIVPLAARWFVYWFVYWFASLFSLPPARSAASLLGLRVCACPPPVLLAFLSLFFACHFSGAWGSTLR
jgi:hypothetical protein